jgi:hypothetical protein
MKVHVFRFEVFRGTGRPEDISLQNPKADYGILRKRLAQGSTTDYNDDGHVTNRQGLRVFVTSPNVRQAISERRQTLFAFGRRV